MDNFWDGTLWVCVDCFLTREGDGPTEEPEREPWGLLDDTYQVGRGLAEDDHSEDCNCELVDFSWSACDACGSDLGGERRAYSYRVVS